MHLSRYRLYVIALIGVFTLVAFGCTPSDPSNPGETTTSSTPTSTTTSTTTTSSSTSTPVTTPWTFTLRVGMPDYLVTKYGGAISTRAKVDAQIVEVNSYYGALVHPVKFVIKEFYTFTGSPIEQRNAPHNGADYLLTYSEDPVVDLGGWEPQSKSVVIRWTPADGGVFGQYGAKSLVHELGHSRGGIDMYALRVMTNTVNGALYDSTITYPGFMSNEWWNATSFDPYDAAVINASGTQVYNDDHVVWQSLPTSYKVVVKNLSGAVVPNASVSVYPVGWFTYTVTPTPSLSGNTSTSGTWTLPSNPFVVGGSTKWNLGNPMQLVTASYAGKTGYAWSTLPAAGLSYFGNSSAPFTLNVIIS